MFGLTGFEEQQAVKVCSKVDQLEMGDDALFSEDESLDNDIELENTIELRKECGIWEN